MRNEYHGFKVTVDEAGHVWLGRLNHFVTLTWAISALLGLIAVWQQNFSLGLSSQFLNLVAGVFAQIVSEMTFPGLSGLVPNINFIFYVFLLLLLLTLIAISVWRAM